MIKKQKPKKIKKESKSKKKSVTKSKKGWGRSYGFR